MSEEQNQPIKRGRGRPKGSKGKPKILPESKDERWIRREKDMFYL